MKSTLIFQFWTSISPTGSGLFDFIAVRTPFKYFAILTASHSEIINYWCELVRATQRSVMHPPLKKQLSWKMRNAVLLRRIPLTAEQTTIQFGQWLSGRISPILKSRRLVNYTLELSHRLLPIHSVTSNSWQPIPDAN
ncbi:hypothetical protein Y032_0129g1468 [Ancylostoma ceylanicum]|uniref:Uncharacterized protein n=1 Tax=Ancylostoma ceylanicum TaxID=53326 RepID=A0A016T7C4_9BILA|nr:hypothetical protein Y032_0129g1468 [Ancylostoma ceylanicum]